MVTSKAVMMLCSFVSVEVKIVIFMLRQRVSIVFKESNLSRL